MIRTIRSAAVVGVLALGGGSAAAMAQADPDLPRAPSAGSPASEWPGPTLCESGENVLWSCSIKGGKTISVCASRRISATEGYIQYRMGKPGKLELAYPASRVHPRGRFEYRLYIQGNTSLSFRNGGYEYSLVDDLRSAEDEVLVDKDGKLVSRIVCNSGGTGFEIVRPDLLGISESPYGN